MNRIHLSLTLLSLCNMFGPNTVARLSSVMRLPDSYRSKKIVIIITIIITLIL